MNCAHCGIETIQRHPLSRHCDPCHQWRRKFDKTSDANKSYRIKRRRGKWRSAEYQFKKIINAIDKDVRGCTACGGLEKDGVKLTIDHIIPLGKGGTHEIENLQILCDECNQKKGDKIIIV